MSTRGKRSNLVAVLLGALAMFFVGTQATPAQAGLLGDVNLDGATNILDIQGGINQALGRTGKTVEADLDEDDAIDILDIQNLVNTVLGEGGLVQRVGGTLDYEGDPTRLRIRAVSMDGLTEECDVDPETNRFLLRLRVKNSWAIALCEREQVQEQVHERCLGTFDFEVVGDETSCTMPIPGLSLCSVVSLGDQLRLNEQGRLNSQSRVREMVAQMSEPIDPADGNGNGMPDFCEPLLYRARERQGQGGGGGEGQGGGGAEFLDVEPLLEIMRACIDSWLDEITTPDLTDDNEDGVPDFVEPLLDCLELAAEDWLAAIGISVPPDDNNGNGIPDYVDAIIAHVEKGIPAWLLTLGRPELVDEDEDGVPDFIEHHLSVNGIPSYVDKDGNGIPDFAEDHDGDGIPNIADEDYRCCPEDCDGDGVEGDQDLDGDGDGVPGYADADPQDPDVA